MSRGPWEPEVIDQAIPLLEDTTSNGGGSHKDKGHPPVELAEHDMAVWSGRRFATKEGGELDRSDTLFWIGCAIARGLRDAPLSDAAKADLIEKHVAERDETLGYRKYAGRSDQQVRYRELAWEVIEDVAKQPELKKERRHPHQRAAKEPPNNGNGDNIGLTKRLADAILDKDAFTQDAGGKLYRFTEGVYKQYAERYIRRRVKELLEEWEESGKWSSHRANEVVEYVRVDAPLLWEKPPTDEVNVLNGILNVTTRELRPHTAAYLSPIQLPVKFDADATCPEWERFAQTTFPEDAHELLFEIAADLMTPERSEQKSILFIGEGSNGKSTGLTALSAFLGSTNIVGLSLQKMESDRFSASRLVGKLANICPDLPSSHLTGTSMFKAVTGGDAINAEYKYKESFEFRPFVRMIFSANQVPRSEDATHAFFRRWLVVPFDRTFEGDEVVPRQELDAKLSDPNELSGVLNKALEVLPRIREKGFTESESMREAWEEFRSMTDPVSVWLDKATTEHAQAKVAKSTLHAAYNTYCEREARAGMTTKAFAQAIKRLRPKLEETQITLANKRVWAWVGLGLKTDDPDPSGGGVPSLAQDTPSEGGKDGGELSVQAVLTEFAAGGASRSMLDRYLAERSEDCLEFLAKTVVYTLVDLPQGEHSSDAWRDYLPVIKEAATKWEDGS